MLYFYKSFSAKEPYDWWLSCKKWPKLKASYGSLPPCISVCFVKRPFLNRVHYSFVFMGLFCQWLQCVCMHIKLQVSFAEYRLFYRALLHKRFMLLRSLLIVATQRLQCVCMCASSCICNTRQHTATHGKTLQHTATHCNMLQHTATH